MVVRKNREAGTRFLLRIISMEWNCKTQIRGCEEAIEAYEGRVKAHEAIGQTDNSERDLKKADALRNKK